MDLAMKKEEEKKPSNKIIYIGGDENFFSNIKEQFQKHFKDIDVEFLQFNSEDPKIIQSYILKIRDLKPKVVLIDFSQNEKAKLHITRIWMRQNFYSKINFIGLCDYKQSKSVIVKAIMTRMPSVHVKSLEYEAVVYSMGILGFADKVVNHGFATAEMDDPIHAFHPCKLSLVNENFIRIESDLRMKPKQILRLGNYWERNKIIRSSLVMCVDQSQENLYYNHEFSQVLQLAHVDPVEQTDNMTKEDFDLKQQKRQELIQESKYRLRKWIQDNQLNSRPKLLKAYVVDKTGSFYDHAPLTDSYSYVFRNQPFISNAKKEITNIKPHLILFNLEDVDKETLEANADIAYTYNDSRMFQHLIKTVKEVSKDFPPIIVCFNSGKYDSAQMQKLFNYPSLLAVKEPMDTELALKMAEKLKDKISAKLSQPKKGDIYIDKTTDLSYAEIETDITLLGCSENDIYFNSLEPLKEGSIIRVSLPVPMYVTIVAAPEFTSINSQYYGIIHATGELEKKELRRFINSVFFRDLDLAKASDAQEVEKLKEDYIKRKQAEAEAKKEALKAQKAAEEKEKATDQKAQKVVNELGE